MKSLGINDDSGVFEALASQTYWTEEQILSGDFGVCSQGIIDVGISLLALTDITENIL